MAINLTDSLNAATTKGKLGDAKQVFLNGDTKNLQQAHEETNTHLGTLDNRSTQMENAIKDISVTGGASTASAVSYDNSTSKLKAVSAQGALDEASSIVHFAKRGSTINISTNYNTSGEAEVLTLSQAIAKVPSSDRVLGFQSNILTAGGWVSYKFIGTDITQWDNAQYWSKVIDSSILSDELGDSETTVMSQKAVKKEVNKLNANTGISEYPTFSSTSTYTIGDIVNYQGLLYEFTAKKDAGEWDTNVVKSASFVSIFNKRGHWIKCVGTERVTLSLNWGNVDSVLCITREGSVNKSGLNITYEDNTKSYPGTYNHFGFDFKFIQFSKPVKSAVLYSNDIINDADICIIPNTSELFYLFKNSLENNLILSDSLNYYNVCNIIKYYEVSDPSADVKIYRLGSKQVSFKINNTTYYDTVTGSGKYVLSHNGITIKLVLDFPDNYEEETPLILDLPLTALKEQPFFDFGEFKEIRDTIYTYSDDTFVNKCVRVLYIETLDDTYSNDEIFYLNVLYRGYGSDKKYGISIVTSSDNLRHFVLITNGEEREGVIILNGLDSEKKIYVYAEIDFSLVEVGSNKVLGPVPLRNYWVKPICLNESVIEKFKKSTETVDITTTFSDKANEIKEKRYDDSWIPIIEYGNTSSIIINSQDEFDNINSLISAKIEDGYSTIIVNFNCKLLYYDNFHIKVNSATAHVVFNGNGVKFIGKGNTYNIYEATSYIGEYHVHEYANKYNPKMSVLNIGQDKESLIDILNFEKFRAFSGKAIAVTDIENVTHKIPLQYEEIVLDESSCSELYIMTTTGWTSQISKVYKVVEEDGVKYAYISFTGGEDNPINQDYNSYNTAPRYKFLNKIGSPLYIKDGYIYIHNAYKTIHISEQTTAFDARNISLGSLSVNNFTFIGNAGGVNFTGVICAVKSSIGIIKIYGCTFYGCVGPCVLTRYQNNVIVERCRFIECLNIAVQAIQGAYGGENIIIRDNFANHVGGDRTQAYVFGVSCKNAYIGGNTIKNFYHGGIYLGFWFKSGEYNASGIIENNDLYNDKDFDSDYAENTLQDLGKIYLSSRSSDTVVRYNRVISGRNFGTGGVSIYIDGGGINTSIYGNLLIDPFAGKSLYQKWWGELFSGCNQNNAWLYNIICNNIYTYGSEITPDSTILGKNFVLYNDIKPSVEKDYGNAEDDVFIRYTNIDGFLVKIPDHLASKFAKIDLPYRIKGCII